MRWTLVRLFSAAVLVTVAVIPAPTARAQGPDPALALARLRERLREGELPMLAPAPEASAEPPSTDARAADVPYYGAWSRIVFQSNRDGNWEIYSATPEGGAQTRLTHSPASDMRPQFNRGCTRIAFDSNRDGNREIYAMNADGSGLTRLTTSPAADVGPVWSPDGRRILFSSDRDGNPELYSISSDGTDVRRLTNSPLDDYDPDWSPDGRHIVWVREVRNSLLGTLWVADADGANAHVLVGPLPVAEHPKWSADGTMIAFDYSVQGDGFTDGAVVNADGSGLRHFRLGSGSADIWMGQWSPSPGDLWVEVSTIVYGMVNGDWVMSAGIIERCFINAPFPPDTIIGQQMSILLDWQTSDVTAPVVTFDPPRWYKTSDPKIPIEFSVSDAGGSEVASSEVQMLADGQWVAAPQAWGWGPFWFLSEIGATYCFRVRASDYAGNISPWVGGADHPMTVYAWKVAGQVLDVRDRPVPLATLSRGVPFPAGAQAGPDGRFTAVAASMDWFWIYASHPGYRAGDMLAVSGGPDVDGVRVHVTGADEAVANGGFEVGGLAGWQAEGGPATLSSDAFTGQGAARIGPSDDLAAYGLPGGDGWAPPSIGIDSAGRAHVAYTGWAGNDRSLLYTEQLADGTWTAPIELERAFNLNVSALVVDSGDTVHVVWKGAQPPSQPFPLRYRFKSPGNAWSTAISIPGATTSQECEIHLAVDASRALHVVWDDRDRAEALFYVSKPWAGAWTAPARLPADPQYNWNLRPSDVQVSADGTAHVVWPEGPVEGASPHAARVAYSRKPPGGAWSTPQTIVLGIRTPALAIGPGVIYAYWQGGDPPRLRLRASLDGGQTWGSIREVSGPCPYLNGIASIVPDAGGVLHALWAVCESWGYGLVQSRSGDRGVTWTEPIVSAAVNSNTVGRAVADSAHNRLWIGWGGGVAVADPMNAPAADTVFRQTLAVSETMHAATLSFASRLDHPGGGPAGPLTVRINDVPVYTATTTSSAWSRAWVDVSAWRGTTITLTLQVHNSGSLTRTWAMLDDVSIASWWTPVIESVTPPVVPPMTHSWITIRGRNFSRGAYVSVGPVVASRVEYVDENTIRAELPAALPPGKHRVWVVNAGGQEGLLNDAVRAQYRVALPIVVHQ